MALRGTIQVVQQIRGSIPPNNTSALAVLAGMAGRVTAPAALGQPFDPEARE